MISKNAEVRSRTIKKLASERLLNPMRSVPTHYLIEKMCYVMGKERRKCQNKVRRQAPPH